MRWFDWDPTKWLIRTLGGLGLARGLRATPRRVIERARLKMAALEVESRLPDVPSEIREAVRIRMDRAGQFLERAVAHWNRAHETKREWLEQRASPVRAGTGKKNLRAHRGRVARAREERPAPAEVPAP